VDPNTGEALARGEQLQGFSFGAEQERADEAGSGSPRHPAADKVYLIEEEGRPGQLMPIMEDEHGTYIMNSKDLRAVELVEKLAGSASIR
jgi:putative protease